MLEIAFGEHETVAQATRQPSWLEVRPRPWRVTALLTALLLGELGFVCAQGLLAVIVARPATQAQAVALTTHGSCGTRAHTPLRPTASLRASDADVESLSGGA